MRSVIGVMSVGHTCPTKTLRCREGKVTKNADKSQRTWSAFPPF